MRMCVHAANSSTAVDNASAAGDEEDFTAVESRSSLAAIQAELEALRGQLAAATETARSADEAAHEEIAALQAEVADVRARLQRSRVERARAGLALEKATELNRKAMMTPVQIYTVFMLGFAKGRLKTQQDLRQQRQLRSSEQWPCPWTRSKRLLRTPQQQTLPTLLGILLRDLHQIRALPRCSRAPRRVLR